ncbi:XRE family transcriptional regulator [Undibacterium sp.]|jgi:transcriptional regulator with XRE-family HTH domain|uniref:helix-turn-helix domain-containing protein n=1 Tax=Undibacterium sp. TaxID=1914977 RepID=UPI002B70CDCF|nr:XRE family transcriptional regulator [Undibacterium sp.]HTD05726.1 XRE family transcriptional regulator [Undibacterium sp.]
MRNDSIHHSAAAPEPAASELPDPMEMRLALRLAALRAERGQSLDELAIASGISRATLSRLERGETSPTASLLGKLCAVYGISMSRLLADVESQSASLVPRAAQSVWVDPESGFHRRIVSPPSRDFKMEMVEVTLPAGGVVSYDAPTVHGTELHLWMLDGILELTIDGAEYRLTPGDCLRFHMRGAARFVCPGPVSARYASLSCAP